MPSHSKAHLRPRARELQHLVNTHKSGRKVAAVLGIPHTTVATWIRQLKAGKYDDTDTMSAVARAAGVPPFGAIPPLPDAPPAPPPPPPKRDFGTTPDLEDREAMKMWVTRAYVDVVTDVKPESASVAALNGLVKFMNLDGEQVGDAGAYSAADAQKLRVAARRMGARLGQLLQPIADGYDQRVWEALQRVTDPDERVTWEPTPEALGLDPDEFHRLSEFTRLFRACGKPATADTARPELVAFLRAHPEILPPGWSTNA